MDASIWVEKLLESFGNEDIESIMKLMKNFKISDVSEK